MTINEHLLIKIMEECDETSQRCAKALCYGEKQIQECQELNNMQRVQYEFSDLMAMMEIAEDRGLLTVIDRDAINRKKEKYFIELGKSITIGKIERDAVGENDFKSLTYEEKLHLLEGEWGYDEPDEYYKNLVVRSNCIPTTKADLKKMLERRDISGSRNYLQSYIKEEIGDDGLPLEYPKLKMEGFREHFESIDPKNFIPDHSNLISKEDKDRIIVLKGMLKELPVILNDENMDKMSEIGEEIREIGRKYERL